MEAQSEMDRNKQDIGEKIRKTAGEERHKSERLARQLSGEAMQQWQRSIGGFLALPTATALGLASTTLYLAALVERGFEVLQQSTDAMRAGLEHGRRDMRESEQSQPAMGGSSPMRPDGERSKAHS